MIRSFRPTGKIWPLLLAAALCCCLAACGKTRKVEIPQERSTLLLEIFSSLDRGKYDDALPLIRRYKTIDDTNDFLNKLEDLTLTNSYLVRIRALLEAGRFAEADTLADELLNHGQLDDRSSLKQYVAALRRADELLRKMEKPLAPAALSDAADELKRVAQTLPQNQKLLACAQQKKADAAALEALEKDRRCVWLWFDALEEQAAAGHEKTAALAAFISVNQPDGDRSQMVKSLMNGGMFDLPDRTDLKPHNP